MKAAEESAALTGYAEIVTKSRCQLAPTARGRGCGGGQPRCPNSTSPLTGVPARRRLSTISCGLTGCVGGSLRARKVMADIYRPLFLRELLVYTGRVREMIIAANGFWRPDNRHQRNRACARGWRDIKDVSKVGWMAVAATSSCTRAGYGGWFPERYIRPWRA